MKACSSVSLVPGQPGEKIERRSFLLVLSFVLGLTFSAATQSAVICVDVNGPPGGDGSSWVAPLQSIQEGIIAAASGDEIWVAQGVYRESITIADGVALYGGFVNGATELASRDFVVHVTTIDASTADAGGPADHVVVMNGLVGSRLDGFTITGGLADGPGEHRNGGGIFCNDLDDTNTIAHCRIVSNRAADGIYSSTPEERNGGNGGGIFLLGSSPMLQGCVVSGNAAGNGSEGDEYERAGDGGHGGGIYCATGSPTFFECSVLDNSAGIGGTCYGDYYGGIGGNGGGLYCWYSSPAIYGCTVERNQTGGGGSGFNIGGGSAGCKSGDGGGVFAFHSSIEISDSRIALNGIPPGGYGDSGGDGGMGGGLCIIGDSSPTLSNCTIVENYSGGGQDAGPHWGGLGGPGGGICCISCSPTITNCVIDNNHSGKGGSGDSSTGLGGGGGALYLSSCPTAFITSCTISANMTGDGGTYEAYWFYDKDQETSGVEDYAEGAGGHGGDGGGLHVRGCAPFIKDCVVQGNLTGKGGGAYDWYTAGGNGGRGGGIFLAAASPVISGCIIRNNLSGDGGSTDGGDNRGGDGGHGAGICSTDSSVPFIINSIVANNKTGDGGECTGYTENIGGDGGCGAGIYGSAALLNCAIVDGTAGVGGSGSVPKLVEKGVGVSYPNG